ncbi:type III secretion system translocon subunit SctE [Candidatus Chlamydia sanziniae]|uniref:Phage tail fiber protein n=1 Tax=Candidatus Chlamydia sanziniae TaxID=1806891 RepID=A0A1A9HUE0_9CHLA|nr:type III secretion system translocon subunit SctE [Candidatus Chlamydia sanziniae]ANH78608.1 Phage tail fiber protein [Candidatus Chlamydia sanziniae]
MTSGVSGNSNQDPTLAAQLAQNTHKTTEATTGHETTKASKQGTQVENAAAGFEELIQETSTQGSSKKESTSATKKSSKSDKSSKTSSKTSVSSASSTVTAQAVKGPKGLSQNNYELPQLPEPETTQINGTVLKKGMGTLALLGLVMTLMAQAAGKSWEAAFSQQNQAIQAQVENAPAIGEAIKNQANSQAAATEAQAKQSMISGIVNLVGFAVSVGAGALSALKGASSSIKAAAFTKQTGTASTSATSKALTSATSSAQQTAATASTTAASSAGSAASKAAVNLTDDMATATSKATSTATKGGGIFGKVLNTPNWSEKISRGLNVAKVQGGRVTKFASKTLSSSMQMSQLMHGITAGIEGIVGGVMGSEIAHQQRQAGAFEAQSEMMKQMSSVYGQQAGQAGQLQEQAQQSFNSALQTLQNIADSHTQTSSAIFN